MVKKMTKEEQVYEELRKKMNEAPLRAPRTPSLMKLLKFFFPTIEDAEVAKYLESGFGEGKLKTAVEVAKESGKDVEKVKEILDRLSIRVGGVGRRERPEEPGVMEYSLGGTWGMSDLMGTLGKDDTIDPSGITYREVIDDYYKDGYLLEWGPSKYPMFRTLMVDQPIDAEAKVLSYELASGVIKANQTVAIGWCNCRVRHRRCNHRIDNCFLFGATADMCVQQSKDVPGARPINYVSQEEALKILDESFKEGLVASTMNNSDPTQAGFICMCCTCCCHVTGGYAVNLTGWGNPYHTLKSNFEPKCDEAKCLKGCRICVELCPVKARWHHYPHQPDLSDDFIFFEDERCFGCGICAFNCPTGALTMVRVRELTPEPDRVSQINRVHREARH